MAKTKDTTTRKRKPTSFINQQKGSDGLPMDVRGDHKSTEEAERAQLLCGPGTFRVARVGPWRTLVEKAQPVLLVVDNGAPEPAAPEEAAPDAE